MLDNTPTNEEIAAPQPPAAIDPDPNALRARVRDYAAAHSTSLRSIALLCDIPESTFTAWLAGTFKGNNEKLDRKVLIWAQNEANAARIKGAAVQEIRFAETPAARKFMGALEHAQILGDVVVVTGGSGVGKTTACGQYIASHPNVWMLTAEPLLSGAFSMAEYLRETLGIPQTAPHKLSRAIALKLAGRRGLIIIDEAQNLETRAIEQLRAIHDRIGIGMAIIGTEEVWGRIDGGGRKAEFARLFSRVGMRVNAPRPTAKDVDMVLDAADIDDPKQRSILKFIANKPGALRGMINALRTARLAADGAKEELNDTHIAAAWAMMIGANEATP